MTASPDFPRRLLIVYLGGAALLLALTLVMTGGHFSYSLDDPYIHLALAQQIVHGHYGLNASEPSAPSSSVLWPFLLAPLSRTAIAAWVPLALNLIFGAMACIVMGRIADRWWLGRGPGVSAAWQWVMAWALVLAADLFALTFFGMEHTLQILLICGCVYGLLSAYNGEPIPNWALLCAGLAPAVRYEDLAFTLPVVLACWWQGRRAAAAWTWVGALAPLAAFSLFLHRLGLYWLPTSVLMKGGVTGAHQSLFVSLRQQIVRALDTYLKDPLAIPITLAALLVILLAWKERKERMRCRVLAASALGAWLMMLLGPYGWFHRYDACVRLFVVLILMSVVSGMRRIPTAGLVVAIAVISLPNIKFAIETAPACTRVYRQQYQMHRFVDDFYQGNVAINDLGWVGFNHGDHRYVLDLYGLASQEAAAQGENKSAAWLDDVTRRHDVGLVMIFRDWFPDLPASWTPVAVLHQHTGRIKVPLSSDAVVFYATGKANLPQLQAQLHAFAKTLPPKTWMTFPGAGMR